MADKFDLEICIPRTVYDTQIRPLTLEEYIGQKIRTHRVNNNLSINKLSKLAGIDRKTLTYMERGENKRSGYNIQKVYAICKSLELKSTDILPF